MSSHDLTISTIPHDLEDEMTAKFEVGLF